jgi:UDP-N-acetylglucosamine--N-acetylmuramyl-(pentapeptide) pyrophosphoryl-undecaprenol N-acetylglucosamine transferase
MTQSTTSTHILITGGHVTPAYALIEELQKRGFKKLYFTGRKYTDRSKKDISFEYTEITRMGIPFYHLTTGRLSRNVGIHTLYDTVAFFYGFISSLFILNKVKPHIIISFGGYLALPITIVGWLLGITVFTHEQTIAPGISNRIIGTIADKVFVSFAETASYFGSHKTIHTGNLIRKKLLQKGRPVINKPLKKPLLFITGGSLGSHSLNMHIEKILGELVKKFTIIHQVGNVSEFGDYERLSKIADDEYYVYKNLSAEEMAWAYNQSEIIVCRSGANTIWELIMLKKPAVLVPLPWSGRNEQRLQARFFTKNGLGEGFDQIESSEVLLRKIDRIHTHRKEYENAFEKLPKNFILPATSSIADIIEECIK